VDVRLGEGVIELRGGERVEEVVTASGARVPCAFVVVGVGVRPDVAWLAGSGLALGNGVLVDSGCQTSAPGIFAVGDAAEWPYTPAGAARSLRVRLEHWDNALRQGEVAAFNLLGRHVSYAPVPYFWSDQYDWRTQMAGVAPRWDRLVLRGRPDDGAFAACYVYEGRLRAALAVNRVREFLALKKLVAAGATLRPEELADDSVDLKALAARAGGQ
ncbi:MAG: FAD-dependent oxidoreductase, partial [Ktedonobacterales bacterium]|nr:FAD-dependent oxidoreductase [Ktedonobacterales bacterium]